MNSNFRVWLLTVILLAAASSAQAQPAGKVYRVGRVSGGLSSSTSNHEAIRRELRELGYVEGKNLIFENRYAEEKPERLAGLADELVRLKVDVIIAGGPNDALAAKKATKTIPIVFTDSPADPVARGLVDSLARPGGNVTGFFSMAEVLAGKRLEVLKESLVKLTKVAILWYPAPGRVDPQWTESEAAARQLGLQLYSMKIGATDNYENAFKEAVKFGSTALAVTRHRRSQGSGRKQILELAAKHKLPAI